MASKAAVTAPSLRPKRRESERTIFIDFSRLSLRADARMVVTRLESSPAHLGSADPM
jgi:hypothetical protein